jgi:hypothetical protein
MPTFPGAHQDARWGTDQPFAAAAFFCRLKSRTFANEASSRTSATDRWPGSA